MQMHQNIKIEIFRFLPPASEGSQVWMGGTPFSGLDGGAGGQGVTPSHVWMGGAYVAGGMPLAFTQEDFLV